MSINLSLTIYILTIIIFIYYLRLPQPIIMIRNKDNKITCCNECIFNK